MLFAELAAVSAAVASTSGRRRKVELLAAGLHSLAAEGRASVEAGAAYLVGEMRQRRIGVGWASLRDVPPPAPTSTLTVLDVDRRLDEIAAQDGAGSIGRRRALVAMLFAQATVDEQRMLGGVLSGELRQGAQAGLLADAVAVAAEVTPTAVRRALLLCGDLRMVAVAALTGGAEELSTFHLSVGRALAPMLAQSAASIDEAIEIAGAPAAVDAKLDGVRVQVHRDGDDVSIFSRTLYDITARLPGVVAVVRALPVRSAVLDGEVIAVDRSGRPRPFQETSGRAARQSAPTEAGELSVFFFDALHLDGTDLFDEPGRIRWAALDEVVPARHQVSRTVAGSAEQARAAFTAALAHGQEGVVVKSLEAGYDVGRRGSAWVKVKPRHTLDLVVLAAEWGHGRRQGWLSNLHLGARDPAGGFVMLGKTFKGLTDEVLTWQTRALLEIAQPGDGGRDNWVVRVRPELVVEVALDGVQASSRYPGGVALRFARVLRYRPDKSAVEADEIATVVALLPRS